MSAVITSVASQPKAFVSAKSSASRTKHAAVHSMKNALRSTPLVAKKNVTSIMYRPRDVMSSKVYAVADGTVLDRPLRVAVIGGGPSGACAAETLAKGGVETFLIERKMDNCKVCAHYQCSTCFSDDGR
jgi:heterodisulfide reductase subunit A-like polyferredoxin